MSTPVQIIKRRLIAPLIISGYLDTPLHDVIFLYFW